MGSPSDTTETGIGASRPAHAVEARASGGAAAPAGNADYCESESDRPGRGEAEYREGV